MQSLGLKVESREGSYLFKPGRFIIFFRQTLEEAVDIASDIISASQSYFDPVPPPSSQSSSDSESDPESSESRCYCCNHTSESKVKLDIHHRTHKGIKCEKGSKYFKLGTFSRHKRLFRNASLRNLSPN